MNTTVDQRDRNNPVQNRLLGSIRRMAIKLTARALWQLVGFRLPNGAGSSDEVITAEPFLGIGFHARPPANGKPEAIVVMVGADSEHPAVIAVRDEKTRAAIAGALADDEAMMFNSQAFVHVKADGTVEVRKPGGAAVALATLADVQDVRNSLHGHSHTYIAPGSGGSAAVTTGNPAVPAPTGTTVLKGQ